jgi:hypothetical protein
MATGFQHDFIYFRSNIFRVRCELHDHAVHDTHKKNQPSVPKVQARALPTHPKISSFAHTRFHHAPPP